MGSIKKSQLKANKLKRVSSPGAIAAALNDKPEKDASVNIALVEWDFAVDGGAEGVYDLTSKVKNINGLGDFILYAGYVAKTAVTAVGASVSIGNTNEIGNYISFTGSKTAGTKDGWISNGMIETVASEGWTDVKMEITDAPVTSGKIVIAIAYVRTR